jgi:hypothetical protein
MGDSEEEIKTLRGRWQVCKRRRKHAFGFFDQTGIQADFEFREFSPVPSGVLSAVQFYTATSERLSGNWF